MCLATPGVVLGGERGLQQACCTWWSIRPLMIIVCDLRLGWTRHPSRRSRQPAAPKPSDPRKTVKPTPRGKYGLAPRRQKLEQIGEEEGLGNTAALDSSSRAIRQRHTQLYQQIVEGTWPGLAVQQHQHKQLFSRAKPHTVAPVTPALLKKVIPDINNTNYWPRLQRKILPKFMFVLNDVAAVALLKTLVRLQPQPASPACVPTETAAAAAAAAHSRLCNAATITASQPQVLLPKSAYAVSSSITGTLHRRHRPLSNSVAARSAAPPVAGQTAVDAAAVARGFSSAADERSQFDLMLTALYTVFQHKLAHWGSNKLVKILGYVARLGVPHEGLLQSWFSVTASQLGQLDATRMMVCIEALAALNTAPPKSWSDSWVVASRNSLQQLSLQQLAMLLLHIAELQLPQSWWKEYRTCVLTQARFKQQPTRLSNQQPSIQHEGTNLPPVPSLVKQQQQQQQQQISRPAADSLCSILWSLSISSGHQADVHWLQECLALLLPAVAQSQCSASAAVQLLHACTLGVCSQLSAAQGARHTCLVIVQQRAPKVCASSGALRLLLQCLLALGQGPAQESTSSSLPQQEHLRQQQQQLLPIGFCSDFEAALAPALPDMPFDVQLLVASALSCLQHQPSAQLLSSFVLATCSWVPLLGGAEVAQLVGVCSRWGVVMPTVWLISVIQHLAQQVQQQVGPVTSDKQQAQQQQQNPQYAGQEQLRVKRSHVAEVLETLPRLGASWHVVQETQTHALSQLITFSHAAL